MLLRQSPQGSKIEILNNDCSQRYIVKTNPPSVFATRDHNSKSYFDNITSYHISYNIHNFNKFNDLQLCTLPQNDITLANRLAILSEDIRNV